MANTERKGGREMQIKAYDLMKLAAENPQKYEGKRYKVVDGAAIEPSGKEMLYEVKVNKHGRLVCGSIDNWAYISVYTELEEIKPEPKPVPVLDAVAEFENGKAIRCEESGATHVYNAWRRGLKDENGEPVTAREILRGTWYIVEGEEG
jgi:hypothetical protein